MNYLETLKIDINLARKQERAWLPLLPLLGIHVNGERCPLCLDTVLQALLITVTQVSPLPLSWTHLVQLRIASLLMLCFQARWGQASWGLGSKLSILLYLMEEKNMSTVKSHNKGLTLAPLTIYSQIILYSGGCPVYY